MSFAKSLQTFVSFSRMGLLKKNLAGACIAAVSGLCLVTGAMPAQAQGIPPHVNVTQGQPWSGCTKRTESLKPSNVPFFSQNHVDPAKVYVLKADRILDPESGKMTNNGHIVVKGQCIVGINSPVPAGAEAVELGDVTLMPGLIDLHTHMFLRDEDQTFPYSVFWKATTYRTIEGVDAAIKTLGIGFTTIRDTDHEGAYFADTALRDAIARGIVPGPRMLVATSGISITGGDMNYMLLNQELQGVIPEPVDMADSQEELVRHIRKQIKLGADWVKIYGTSTRRQTDPIAMEPVHQFTEEDIRLAVTEAARYKRDVAVHVYGGKAAQAAILGGARTIEHGPLMTDENIKALAKNGTYWIPTMGTYEKRQTTDFEKRFVKHHKEVFQKALKYKVKIGFGTDVGSFTAGTQNDEFDLMAEYGMSPLQVIRSATTVAAEVLRMDGEIGTLAAKSTADIIAVAGNPLEDVRNLKKVRFVMASGRIFRNDITGQKFDWAWGN
jgi:imidazolonepropionase-like amidohydrolase